MATNEYDAIVVGARCAGSPTAMLLARKGHKVLLVDKDRFPSDTLSTHMVHPPGIALLQQWGLLDRLIATGCPAIQRYKYDFGPFTIAGRPRPAEGVDVGYGPRRVILDKLLIDAAAEAGAEVREGFTVRRFCSRTVASPASAATRKAPSPSPRTPASSSALTACTRSSPKRFGRSSTTRSRRSSPVTTRTGATCRPRGSRSTSVRIEAGGSSPPTTI